ncbi:MAG: hypothetical protein JNN08_17660 [Bryobacterales bacterium]|nr:hypothetical protein [Bryobacterales bacterium]
MPVVQGIVAPNGVVVRADGDFEVLSKGTSKLRIQVTGQQATTAFVLATAWRDDGDIGSSNAAISASPDPKSPDVMIFAVDEYYGVSFRIEP